MAIMDFCAVTKRLLLPFGYVVNLLSLWLGLCSCGPSKLSQTFRNLDLRQTFHLAWRPGSLLLVLWRHEALVKGKASFHRHLAFPLRLQQRIRIQHSKLSFLTAFHWRRIKIDISNTVKWFIASDSTGFWDPVYITDALHTQANPCHWHQLRTVDFITQTR